MKCAAHPDIETNLRCGKCGTPVCPKCMVPGPVGVRCPQCARATKLPTFKVSGRYYLRGEPLDTLERIQDAYLNATKQELEELAERFLDPSELQIFIVADKAIPVKHADGKQLTLEQEIRALAEELGLPYQEIELR